MHPSVCLRLFMSCALATHQWLTKWAVFLDGLLRILLLEMFQCIFLTPCTIPDSQGTLKRSVYRQVLREPLVHSLISLNGTVVSWGAQCYFISFFLYSNKSIINFPLVLLQLIHISQLEIFLVRHVSQIRRFLTSVWISYLFLFFSPVLVDYRDHCQHK